VPLRELKDRVAVVTGAANGFGRAVALELARAGMHVVAADFDGAGARRLADEIAAMGRRSHAVETDVREMSAIERLLGETLAALGACHLVVNNAGVFHASPLLEMPVEQWRRVVDTNLWGVIHGSRIFGAHFARQGEGHIVNTASAAGLFPTPGMGAYSTTKFAIVAFSLQLRWELANRGVGVTVLCPGTMKTGIARAAGGLEHVDIDELVRRAPLPEALAVKATRAIRKNRAMVRLGPDSYLYSVLRLLPMWLIDPLGRFMARTAMKFLKPGSA
jgi:NAD(P)-dependent dehydrogenase (short-subunit alcohol dehydrogenase family)